MIPDNLFINIYGKNYPVIVTEWFDQYRNVKCYRLEVKEFNVFYDFSLDNYLHESIYNLFIYHIDRFKYQIECEIFNTEKYSLCTEELILNKYFESYDYALKNKYNRYSDNYITKNPNLILGRQKGHTQALVNFVSNYKNKDIVEDSFIAFPNYNFQSEFFSKLDIETIQRIRFNTITSSTYTIGICKSFIIFNSYFSIRDQINQYLQHPHIQHFIILGN